MEPSELPRWIDEFSRTADMMCRGRLARQFPKAQRIEVAAEYELAVEELRRLASELAHA